MTYQVKLDVFEGPFDLLLHLTSRRKVDVAEVDLAEITRDFLDSLAGIEDLDLETATRFLVVAATLIELKAARLLPSEQQEELEDLLGEARDLLYARLLEYRAFRHTADIFRGRYQEHGGHYPREVALDPDLRRLVPDAPLPVDKHAFARIAAVATAPRPEPRVDLSHIRRAYLSIRDAAAEVLQRLPDADREGSFRELTAGRTKSDRVVLFLALLELYKLGHLDLVQEDHDASIHIRRIEGGRDLDALTDADYEGTPADKDAPGANADDPETASSSAGDAEEPGASPDDHEADEAVVTRTDATRTDEENLHVR